MKHIDTLMWKEINQTPKVFGEIQDANRDIMSALVKDIKAGNINLEKGDVIRHESSEFKEIERVKSDLSRKHDMKNSRQIIYHLDSTNLSNYSDNEIKYMFMAY